MWRAIASNALTLFVVALVAAAGLLAWGREEYSGPGPLDQSICFRVERGASLSAVSRALEEQGAVSDARIFRIGADYSGKADGLKFGSYLVTPGQSMAQILDSLTAGGQSTCGREVNFRISVARAEVVLRELDPATNRYVEVVAFDPATQAAPAEYLDVAEADDIRWRMTLAEGVTSWQVVDALKRAEFMTGELPKCRPRGRWPPTAMRWRGGGSGGAAGGNDRAKQTATLAELWAGAGGRPAL
jgi:UPF0755 protein